MQECKHKPHKKKISAVFYCFMGGNIPAVFPSLQGYTNNFVYCFKFLVRILYILVLLETTRV